MKTLTIKDVPAPLAERLRQRAARNHRSLQGELMSIIEQAALQAPEALTPAPVTLPAIDSGLAGGAAAFGLERPGQPALRQGWKTMEQVYAELKEKYPEPMADQLSSVALVREDRDRR